MKFESKKEDKLKTEVLDDVFSVDEEDLNKEWVKQSAIVAGFIKKAVGLLIKKRELQRKIDVEYAELSLEIRKAPQKYIGDIKLTEPLIQSIIDVDEYYNKLLHNLYILDYKIDMYQGAVKAMEHKKKSLEYLSQFELVKHYSEPSETAVETKMRKILNKGRKE